MSNIITHTGLGQRKENQDIILNEVLYPDTSLYLIVDGMGGYEKGKEAAEIITNSIFLYLSNTQEINFLKIDEAIKKANQEIKIFNDRHNLKSGGTLAGIVKKKDITYLFWVGDVCIFLFKNQKINFKTKSHTLINDMLESNDVVSPESIEKYKHIVTSSISGKREIITTGTYAIENHDYDSFLICSDGVLETIAPNDFINLNTEDLNRILLNKSKDNYSYIFKIE